jgi:hypothetical protein
MWRQELRGEADEIARAKGAVSTSSRPRACRRGPEPAEGKGREGRLGCGGLIPHTAWRTWRAWRENNSTGGKWTRAQATTGVAAIRQHTVQSAPLLITPFSCCFPIKARRLARLSLPRLRDRQPFGMPPDKPLDKLWALSLPNGAFPFASAENDGTKCFRIYTRRVQL